MGQTEPNSQFYFFADFHDFLLIFVFFFLLGTTARKTAGNRRFSQETAEFCRNPFVPFIGIIERGVPQAYVRARASSATLCSVHVLRVFLCIFYIKKGI